MDAELKAKWVKALRSGEFKQHYGGLHSKIAVRGDIATADALCCIGVGIVANGLTAPSTVLAARALGINSLQENTLVGMNDTDRKPFSEIADYIEREL